MNTVFCPEIGHWQPAVLHTGLELPTCSSVSNWNLFVFIAGHFIAGHTPRKVCDRVLHYHHSEFRDYLNFHCIYPHLRSRNLLVDGSSMDWGVFTSPHITGEQKIDYLLAWLPKASLSDYLTPLIECLEETAEEAGDAHKELATMLRTAAVKEMLTLGKGEVIIKYSVTIIVQLYRV